MAVQPTLTQRFVGCHGALLLTLKAERDVASPRVEKHEQVSAHRWQLVVRLRHRDEVVRELSAWLRDACSLGRSG
jgi:hypothetical protein